MQWLVFIILYSLCNLAESAIQRNPSSAEETSVDADSMFSSNFPLFDEICRDNEDFLFTGSSLADFSCNNIGISAEALRGQLCQIEDIHINCPKACGLCCNDDPLYFILTSLDLDGIRKCSWIREDEGRKEAWCNTFNNGKMVRHGCPVACDACQSYVSLNPSTAPSVTSSPSQTPKPTLYPTVSISPSDSPSNLPSPQPTQTPSEKPTALPSQSPTVSLGPTSAPTPQPPNLIMIITDEHNFRTLGAYRKYLRKIGQPDQSRVWGEGNRVYTPNIDRLAEEGALFSNFYTVSPLCTPSRASFMSGLYPDSTGANQNHARMDADVPTFATILKEKNQDYITSYIGKWHLSGSPKPGWFETENGRKFGFDKTRFKYNRGHWKYFDSDTDSWAVHEYEMDAEGLFAGRLEEHYATDFLFDRGIEDIESAEAAGRPFAMVLSIPDPHGPQDVRPPYKNQMYGHFEYPRSGKAAVKNEPATPKWNTLEHSNIDPNNALKYLEDYENGENWQNYMQKYFAMVECLDANVGKLLDTLDRKGISDNTVVVFTSDHGDMLGEHGKMNKGRPFESSAGIPFLVRYPNHIKPQKVIETAHSSIDFAPTILSLMGITDPGVQFHGIDATPELLNDKMVSSEDNIVLSLDGYRNAAWAAAVMNKYKLVVSKNDVPYLFDVYNDPDEIINYFEDPAYSAVKEKLQSVLLANMKSFNFALVEKANLIYWDPPACRDSRDAIELSWGKKMLCSDLGVSQDMNRCSLSIVKANCPSTCSTCACKDSPGKIWFLGDLYTCSTLPDYVCLGSKVQTFCPSKCGVC